MALNARQQKFVDVFNGNATEAARIAGYTGDDNVLGVTGHDLLRLPKIQEAIAARVTKETKPHILSREELQQFWTDVAKDNRHQLKDRLKATELLGKSRAEFTEKVEHSGTIRDLTNEEILKELEELNAGQKKITSGA